MRVFFVDNPYEYGVIKVFVVTDRYSFGTQVVGVADSPYEYGAQKVYRTNNEYEHGVIRIYIDPSHIDFNATVSSSNMSDGEYWEKVGQYLPKPVPVPMATKVANSVTNGAKLIVGGIFWYSGWGLLLFGGLGLLCSLALLFFGEGKDALLGILGGAIVLAIAIACFWVADKCGLHM